MPDMLFAGAQRNPKFEYLNPNSVDAQILDLVLLTGIAEG
jgi:hypothetical protein